jgi:enoyl-CoA hydratase
MAGERAELVTSERDDHGVVVLRLTNPPLNALSGGMLHALADAAEALASDPDVKAVVVTGAGERAFAAGADISEFGGEGEARIVAANFRRACEAIEALPRPVIAAVNGFALGGGLEIAMACDLRIAAETARMGQPEILLGIIPGGGGTQRLPRLVGPARAKEMIWSGRQVGAEEALATGLVDRVVPATSLLDGAIGWARELAAGAVVAMGLAKRAIHAGLGHPLPDGLAAEEDAFAGVFTTEDAATGIASFLEHGPGKATFSGR